MEVDQLELFKQPHKVNLALGGGKRHFYLLVYTIFLAHLGINCMTCQSRQEIVGQAPEERGNYERELARVSSAGHIMC